MSRPCIWSYDIGELEILQLCEGQNLIDILVKCNYADTYCFKGIRILA